jgi:ABC-type Fe3+-hydroxamate transport system substrate-binding protein
VVSLVPNWTETLFDLGLTGEEILGRTDYCIHPRDRVEDIEKVGGPRDPNVERIFELDPDLIVVDREENRKEDVERIDRHWRPSRVFATGPITVNEALNDVERFGLLFNARNRARELIENVRSLVARVVRKDRGTAAYLVWQDPLIVASRETYIGDVLEILGYKNVFDSSTLKDLRPKGRMGYPVVTVDLLVHHTPDAIFLSTEPFPFRRKDVDRLRSRLHHIDAEYAERVDIQIVNGEYFSWYGSRMFHAFRYFVTHQT